ncbi:copper homeostasis protein CutC [Aquibacillus halophilus]|uniref:PF03932 family protein CutC n=1 Tax=Aquibacillus halophilus TaxID=930132 RepID=A0A6A8DK35_9BACI|nr:copper homeostasis protein CutC [Aquibacillus halophilus]MRH41612.1 copper homeostasis protein CutC [Aquibacillus halophilus]
MYMEVIVQNKEEAIEAEALGVDRLELVSRIDKDGLTPSLDTVQSVVESVSIPVQVMIRPHDYSFCYSYAEERLILEQINQMIEVGASNFVFGALNKNGTINERLLEEVISVSDEISFTFHRAFDYVPSQEKAYKTLVKYKAFIKRILTSGGEVDCVKGKESLKQLVELSQIHNGPIIMPGSGLNENNIKVIHNVVGASEYHFGKGVRVAQSYSNGFDKRVIQNIK